MGFAILRLLYPYMDKSCVHMVFWFENTTFQHFFTCGDSMGWLFHAMELLWFLKIRNSFCLRLCCVYIGRNFWGDFWGSMGCGVPCGRASPVQYWGDYRGPLYVDLWICACMSRIIGNCLVYIWVIYIYIYMIIYGYHWISFFSIFFYTIIGFHHWHLMGEPRLLPPLGTRCQVAVWELPVEALCRCDGKNVV